MAGGYPSFVCALGYVFCCTSVQVFEKIACVTLWKLRSALSCSCVELVRYTTLMTNEYSACRFNSRSCCSLTIVRMFVLVCLGTFEGKTRGELSV